MLKDNGEFIERSSWSEVGGLERNARAMLKLEEWLRIGKPDAMSELAALFRERGLRIVFTPRMEDGR